MTITTAIVTDNISDGFAEVAPLGEDGEPEKRRCIAENPKSVKAKRGDVVEMKPAKPRDVSSTARLAYILPVVAFALVVILMGNTPWGERLIDAAILGFLFFIFAWLMNRRSRLLKRLEFTITKVTKKKFDW